MSVDKSWSKREALYSLDHKMMKQLKTLNFESKRFLVAFSGGVDSAVLLKSLSKQLNISLAICYVHHGDSSNKEYRDRAAAFSEKLATDLKIPYFTGKISEVLKNENEEVLREARYKILQKKAIDFKADFIVLGQHGDDLVETRILRLLRGTGGSGLRAMQVQVGNLFRPMLEFSKAELYEYAKNENIPFIEDPSNLETDPMRNWLRMFWLPALEQKWPGSVSSIGRSLENIVNELESEESLIVRHDREIGEAQVNGLSLLFLESLSPKSRRTLIAQYLLLLKKRDFSTSHIEEVLKRLDSSQKIHTFKVGGCHWSVNAGQVQVLD